MEFKYKNQIVEWWETYSYPILYVEYKWNWIEQTKPYIRKDIDKKEKEQQDKGDNNE